MADVVREAVTREARTAAKQCARVNGYCMIGCQSQHHAPVEHYRAELEAAYGA